MSAAFRLPRKWFALLRRARIVASRAMMCVGITTACATAGDHSVAPSEALTFADYQRDTLDHVRQRRTAYFSDRDTEVVLNAPREWRPVLPVGGAKPARGILLVHGLGDSPWSFNDIAGELAAGGFLVRTILLPGHGTRPEDLLDVELDEWRQVVRDQAAVLRRDVEEVYLGGFSTGANLITEYAYSNPDIAGLALFSPAFKSDTGLGWMTPLLRSVRPWLFNPDSRMPLQNEVRYFMVPTNGFAQFHHSSVAVRRLLERKTYNKPVFMVAVQHDSVLDANYMLKSFQDSFPHPASRLIWYGEPLRRLTDATREFVRPDRLPQERISQFSHMGILFNPQNPLYGRQGSIRICWNGQSEETMMACEAGAPVWFSDWGHREDGKIHARLTFNPYFQWQTSVMMSVLNASRTR